MHLTLRTFGGDVLYFTGAVTIECLAMESTLNHFALRFVEFLGGREDAFDAADRFSLTVEERGKARDSRSVSQDDAWPDTPESLLPLCHLGFAGIERIELVSATHELASFEFQAGHSVELVVSAPEKSDHFAWPPSALLQVAVGAGVAGQHIVAATAKFEGESG